MAENMNNTPEKNSTSELQVRRDKLAALVDAGKNPFEKVRYDRDAYSQDIKDNYAEYEGKTVGVAGRLISKRIMGKASFIEVQDSKGRIQVYVSRDDVQAPTPEGEVATTVEQQMYNVVFKKLLDIGDFIGIEGFTFRTQMGEISVHAQKLTVLAKSLRPLPIVKYKDGVAYPIFKDGNWAF